MTKVKYGCQISAEERREYDSQMSAWRQAQNAREKEDAERRAIARNQCPPSIAQPYDYWLAQANDDFMRTARFTVLSDGYGRAWQRAYVPTPQGDALLEQIRAKVAERDAACAARGYTSSGYWPEALGADPRIP